MARAETAQDWSRPARSVDLLLWCWRLVASAQFAVALIGFLALAGLLAVVLPQMPSSVRDNPVAVDAWLAVREDTFGVFTEPMHRVGLFSVVTAWWFLSSLGLLAVSVCVYTVDRFVATWRNVTRPRERLPDSFFDRAANRLALETAPSAGAAELTALLRRRRFRVSATTEGATTYLFADRFAWAQLGTFLSHAALVLFLVGGVVSRLGGYTNALLIAEGTTSPVFPVSHPEQMLVEVVDAVGRFDATGAPVDYRSELVIYQGGEEVARGVATVNSPRSYNGYRFHQAGYLGEGASLRVRDAATGHTRYQEVLALRDRAPAPEVAVRDARGALVLRDVIVPTDFVEEARGTLIALPGGGQFWVGVRPDGREGWDLVVYAREEVAARFVVAQGQSETADGLTWTFVRTDALPSTVAPGIPGDSERALVTLSETPEGTPYLTLLGPVDGRALTLYPDQPVRIGDREYLFEGRREFAGIEVRRDPGANFIWVAVGLLLAGLLTTFYVPRLRLWARVRGRETVIAAQAERSGVFQAEARRLAQELGATTGEGKPEEGPTDA